MANVYKKTALLLAVDFLDELANRYGTDGCNDWSWPEWVTEKQREALKRCHPDADRDLDAREVRKVENNRDIVLCLIEALTTEVLRG